MISRAFILLVALVTASSVRADSCTHKDRGGQCKGAGDLPLCQIGAFNNPDQNFDPQITPNSTYVSPPSPCPAGAQVDPTLFQAVYTLLNPAQGGGRSEVSNKLCNLLTSLFVTTGGTQAFGIWEVPPGKMPDGHTDRPARGHGDMYISVPSPANLPLKLADQENIMLAAALGVPPTLIKVNGTLPWFTSDDQPFTSDAQPGNGMALLSILAHELGHLLLAETNADGTGDAQHTHPRSLLCNKPGNRGASSNTCFDTAFVNPNINNNLWNSTLFFQGMRRWIKFGDRNGNSYQDPTYDLGTVTGFINNNDLPSANDAIYTLLTKNKFVSLFAALSPEEDVVETYKYKILADVAQTSNLTLNIPGASPVRVLDNVSNAAGDLLGKINCVNSLTK